jgi:hypothetical protein
MHLINDGFEIMQVISKNKILSNLFKVFVDSQPPMDKDFSIMKNLEKKSLNEFFFIT